MKHPVNIGRHERRIRIGIGALLIGIAGLTALSGWGTLSAFFLGMVMLYTGVHQFCPVWNLLGINTCEHHAEHH